MLVEVISNMNWDLLREQKSFLWNNGSKETLGLVHLIDAIQDAAVEDGIASKLEVFGELHEG